MRNSGVMAIRECRYNRYYSLLLLHDMLPSCLSSPNALNRTYSAVFHPPHANLVPVREFRGGIWIEVLGGVGSQILVRSVHSFDDSLHKIVSQRSGVPSQSVLQH